MWRFDVKSFVILCKYNCYNICIIKILFLSLCRKQEKGESGSEETGVFFFGLFSGRLLE